jgi:alanyl-tRNA synthetase
LIPIISFVTGSAQDAAADLQARLGDPAAVFLVSGGEDKVSMVAAFSPAVVKSGLQAGKFVGGIAQLCGGKGGGRPNLAQAGAKDASKIPEALDAARQQLEAALSECPAP